MPGPPKRFEQALGMACSMTAAVLLLGFGWRTAGYVVLGALAAAAALEAIFALCLGCWMFAYLMRLGLIPRTICQECDDFWNRPGRA